MMEFTEKEQQMIMAFYDESVDVCGCCTYDENLSYMNAKDLSEVLGWNLQVVGGVMSSLDGKGAIVDTGGSARRARLNDFILCPKNVTSVISNIENS